MPPLPQLLSQGLRSQNPISIQCGGVCISYPRKQLFTNVPVVQWSEAFVPPSQKSRLYFGRNHAMAGILPQNMVLLRKTTPWHEFLLKTRWYYVKILCRETSMFYRVLRKMRMYQAQIRLKIRRSATATFITQYKVKICEVVLPHRFYLLQGKNTRQSYRYRFYVVRGKITRGMPNMYIFLQH